MFFCASIPRSKLSNFTFYFESFVHGDVLYGVTSVCHVCAVVLCVPFVCLFIYLYFLLFFSFCIFSNFIYILRMSVICSSGHIIISSEIVYITIRPPYCVQYDNAIVKTVSTVIPAAVK